MWNRIQYWIQHRPKTMLFFIFLLTVFIRLPQLTRPLSKHHELNTAGVLICLETWSGKGIAHYHGAPAQYFSGPYDIFDEAISPAPKFTKSGTYLSLGPGSYLLPYVLMQILHLHSSEAFIRVFSLLLHFISTLLIFYFLSYFQKRYSFEKSFAFCGSLLFLTAPAIMWFMGNSYSHESMVIPFYLATFLLGIKIFNDYSESLHPIYAVYALALMATIYTDWLGIFIAFVFFIQGLFIKQFKARFYFLGITAMAVIIAVGIILWQYVSLVGWQEYKLLFVGKMNERSLPALEPKYAFVNYLLYFLVGFGLVLGTVVLAHFKRWKQLPKYAWMLACIPFLHYIVFIGFSGKHDYAVLKWSPLIVLLSTIGIYAIKQQFRSAVLGIIAVSSFTIYECINPPFRKDFKGEKYSWMKDASEIIRKTSANDEYIFTDMVNYYHQVGWYTGRQYSLVNDLNDAKIKLRRQPGSKGVFYHFDSQNQIVSISHFSK